MICDCDYTNEEEILLEILKAGGHCGKLFPGRAIYYGCEICCIRHRCYFHKWMYAVFGMIIGHKSREWTNYYEREIIFWNKIETLLYKKAMKLFVKKYGKARLAELLL